MSQQPCLPVSRRRKRIDDEQNNDGASNPFQNVESMDANEYLAAVVQQASQMPDVFVSESPPKNYTTNNNNHENNENQGVDNQQQEQQMEEEEKVVQPKQQDVFVPIDGSAASLSYLVSNRTALVPPPTVQHLPCNTRVWVDTTLANFSELRHYLDTCKYNGVGGKEDANRIPVPPLKDRSGWHIFCVGHDEAHGNVGSYYDDDDDDDDDENEMNIGDNDNDNNTTTTTKNTVPLWKQIVPDSGHEPSVQLVLQMDQVMVRRVISHLSHYVQDGWSPCTDRCASWLYTLLARLERPIHRDDAAVLYGLLKQLTHVRANIITNVLTEQQRTSLARLNTLIAIIGIYFEQGGGYDGVMTIHLTSSSS